MTADLTRDEEFLRLEKEFAFLRRARQSLSPETMELETLPYTIVDIETTGLDPQKDQIIEIGAVKILLNRGVEKFEELIKPTVELPKEIEALTGIKPEMLLGKPSLKEVLPKFFDFIDDSVLVAHNTEFDLSFLKHWSSKLLDREIKNPSICTVRLARILLPHLENHKLHTVASYFDIEVTNRHRAIGDAELTLQAWLKMQPLLKEKNITNLQELRHYLDSIVPF